MPMCGFLMVHLECVQLSSFNYTPYMPMCSIHNSLVHVLMKIKDLYVKMFSKLKELSCIPKKMIINFKKAVIGAFKEVFIC